MEILERAELQCECEGECDGVPHEPRCPEMNCATARTFHCNLVVLTVAHLNQNPKDNRRSNLKAMCQACHLRYDRFQHARNAAITRKSKLKRGLK